ncbi:MAG: peptidase S24 [Acinetobacter sp.]|uniref:S24 family peptidase n=1 Tax=Acinetobacter sp. TaxID=472 RepID=UPI000DB7ED9A|nr:S24 family peptidase [Acinetobacter sp.]PZT87790.1 MAG: peptidase S24 [Acinetobacter sp.]
MTITIAERIQMRMKDLGLSQADIMRCTKASRGAVSGWVNGSNSPSAKHIESLSDCLRTSTSWLLTGEGLETVDDQIKKFIANTATAITHDQLTEEEMSEKVWINMYDVRFCSGEGEAVEFHFDDIKKRLSFEPSFFEKRNIKSENFKIIINKGDSNEEYLFDGDAVGIDTSDVIIRDGETYALYFEGDALIRQIYKEQGGVLILHPRNPKYKDKIVAPDADLTNFKIIGRVRYRSG